MNVLNILNIAVLHFFDSFWNGFTRNDAENRLILRPAVLQIFEADQNTQNPSEFIRNLSFFKIPSNF